MRSFILIAAIAATVSGSTALAEEAANRAAVRIELDQVAKAFVFIIDDEAVAMLDKEGLHIVSGIDYGRSLTDTGSDWVKDRIASRGKEAADD